MKHVLLGIGVFALAATAVQAQYNPCVAYSVTNCDPAPTLTLAPVGSITNSVCDTVSASTTVLTNAGRVVVTSVAESCAVTHTPIATNYPTVLSNWTAVFWNSQRTTNTGLTASFTPGNAGSGTITFYSKYTTPSPCAGTYTASRSISVTVTDCAPAITLQPASQTVVAGDPATFLAGACGSAPLYFQWAHNGTNIRRAITAAYSLTGVGPLDAGSYTVAITNALGHVISADAVLTVEVPPAITMQPASQAQCAGGSVTFAVSASGAPPPTFQWRKDGTNITGATGATYTIDHLTNSDAAQYSVAVANAVGSVTSDNASLVVGQTAPSVYLAALPGGYGCSVTLTNGQATQFSNTVDGTTLDADAATYNIWAPYASAWKGQAPGCDDSPAFGINISKLPPPVITPAYGDFQSPSAVTISPDQESLEQMVSGICASEVAPAGGAPDPTDLLEHAQTLRAAGYSDEDIRAYLINTYFRVGAPPSEQYHTNTSYFIEYSLDGGSNWSRYSGPIPIAANISLQARACKLSTWDKRAIYAYLTSDDTFASFTYSPPGFDGSGPAYYQVSSPTNLLNVRFTANSPPWGPAAAGFDTGDFWNYCQPGDASNSFAIGFPLNDAGQFQTGHARLWAFTGPYWPDWRWGLPPCFSDGVYSDAGGPPGAAWGSYWSCWWSWLGPFSAKPGCTSYPYPPWASDWSSLSSNTNTPDWWLRYGWRLPPHFLLPLWLPAFDESCQFASPTQPYGVDAMASDGLTSIVQTDMREWLDYCGFHDLDPYSYVWEDPTLYEEMLCDWSQTDAHILITGLPPGYYLVYLYSPTPALVNYAAGEPATWRDDSAGVSVPCTRFLAYPGVDGNSLTQPASGLLSPNDTSSWPSGINWTNEPIWTDKSDFARIRIDFNGVAQIAGLQIVALGAAAKASALLAPVPSAVGGYHAVYLSWPAVTNASGYQIYRSQSATNNFSLVGRTANSTYADPHLAASTLYYYYVVATNTLTTSPPSSPRVPALTFSETSGTVFAIYPPEGPDTNAPPTLPRPNFAPILNYVDPIPLAAQSGSFTIPFVKVLDASDAWDPDGDSISFKVETLYNGQLFINGAAFDPAGSNCTFDSTAVVIWTPWTINGVVPATGLDAFTVRASDGSLLSEGDGVVTILPVPATYLMAWGSDTRGSLGSGTYVPDPPYDVGTIRLAPVRVKGLDSVVMAQSALYGDASGAAVAADGSLWMWGSDYGYGIFGEGQHSLWDTNSLPYWKDIRATPFKVQMFKTDGSALEDFTNVMDVSIDGWSVLAVKSDGSLWSWGCSGEGELGRKVEYEDMIPDTIDWINATKKAGRVTGMTGDSGQELPVIQAVAALGASVALCADGSVWGWGAVGLCCFNGEDYRPYPSGYLTADGTANHYDLPNRQTGFDGGPPVIQIAGAMGHFAALKTDGTVWEFGFVPRLAFTTTNDTPTQLDQMFADTYLFFTNVPVQVTNLPLAVTSIAAGINYSLALLSDGSVYSWGAMGYIGLDDVPSADPVQVLGLTNIVKIAVNEEGSLAMALDRAAHVWAWGSNDNGQLGLDPQAYPGPFFTPQRVFAIENASDIIAGDTVSFAVASLEEGRPTGLIATPLNGGIRLDWRKYPGASYYRAYRASTNGTPGTQVGRPTSNTFTDSGLTNGTTYFYTVSAVVAGIETPHSDEVEVAPIDPPAQPTWPAPSLAVVGTCRSIHLQWNVVTNAAQYQVYRQSADGISTFLATTGGTNFVDHSAPGGVTTYYYVVAENSAGPSPNSLPSPPAQLDTAACPSAPLITAFSIPQDGEIALSWTQPGGPVPEAYRIKWHFIGPDSKVRTITLSTAFDWDDISTNDLGSDGATYTFTLKLDDMFESPCSDLTIWCKISAVSKGEESDDSNLVGPVLLCAECTTNFDAPSGLIAVPGCQQIYLEWNDDPSAAYYQVQYSTNGSDWLSAGDQVAESRFWHTNLLAGTNYEYKVCSVVPIQDGSGTDTNILYVPSPFCPPVQTNPASCTVPPGFSFTAQATGFNGMVYVHWESLTNQPPPRCFVERKLANVNDPYVTITETGFGLAYLDQDVVNGTTYSYRVTALDTSYNRAQSTVTATPTNSACLGVIPTPGNAFVSLAWAALPNTVQYLVKHSLTSGGPYDAVAAVTSGTRFLHTGLQNGLNHYYVVTAVLAQNVSVDSPEVSAMPLATLKPLPPASLSAQIVAGGNNEPDRILFSWASSAGAVSYALTQVLGTQGSGPQITSGPVTACSCQVPAGTSDGQSLTYQVVAFSSQNAASDPTKVTIAYGGQTNGPSEQVFLSVGDHNVSDGDPPLTVTGPTNIVLRASVLADGAGDAQVYFYDGTTVIGAAQGPVAQVTWYHVPNSTHTVKAQAVIQPATSGYRLTASSGTTYDSAVCTLQVQTVPDLASYQSSSTDLQLPAPGLPITLSRSYDSRTTNAPGCLGKGWTASWDQASLQLSTNLDQGWAEAGMGGLWRNDYLIADTAAHVITVTLPGGGSASFAAQLSVPGGSYPFYGDPVMLVFTPFGPNQGFLSCNDLSELYVGNNGKPDWGSDPLWLSTNPDTDSGFVPTAFTYTGLDGTQYVFRQPGGAALTWKLCQIIDRNGNSLAYNYNASLLLTNIVHSNGRQVQLDYVATNDNSGLWINIYDTAYPKSGAPPPAPVLKCFVQTNIPTPALIEFDKLVNRAAGTYEATKYLYGDSSSGANRDRLTDIYDARGVRVLHNEYGGTSDTPPVYDGRLVGQTDALGNVTTYGLDTNLTLTATSTVNGTNQTVTIGHDASGAIASVQAGDQSATNSYDAQGRLIAQADAYGNTKTITYDSQNRPVSQSDPLGNSTSTDYSTGVYNQPGSSTDANGNTSSFEYDNNGNQTATTDPSGTRTETAYSNPITNSSGAVLAAGLVSAQTNYAPGAPYGVVTTYAYYTAPGGSSLRGELQTTVQEAVAGNAIVGSLAIPTTYEYDANGNRTKETRWATTNGVPNSPIVTTYAYDAQNRLVQTTDPLGRASTVTYNKLGKQSSTVDALGRTTTFTYDALGNLIETFYPDGSATRTTYDEKSRALYTQDRALFGGKDQTAGPASLNVYDSAGKVIRVERRSGVVLVRQTATLGTDYQGLSGGDTQYKMTVSSPGTLASCTRAVYDAAGRVQYSMDARGAVTESVYDAAGRVATNRVYTAYSVSPLDTGTIAPSGDATETHYGYDPNGNQLLVQDALGHVTTNSYDSANRLISTTFPHVTGEAGQKTHSMTYDGLGRKVLDTDEAGVTTAFTYDFRGLLLSVTLDYGNNGVTTSYTYDESGNEITQKDASNHTTQFQYDALGRRTKRTLPDSAAETTAYTDIADPARSGAKVLQTAVTDFRGKTIVSTLDVADRLVTKLLPAINNGEQGTTVSYYYTGAGLLSRVNMYGDVNRTHYYRYDGLNRLIQKDTPEGVLAYGYTNTSVQSIQAYRRAAVPINGSIPANTTPDVSAGYGYDTLGRLQSVTNNDIAAPNVTSYYYDAVGNLDHFTYPNGVTHAYTYTEQNRLKALALTRADSSLLRSFDYTLSLSGQRTGVREMETSGGSVVQRRQVAYQYDRGCNGAPDPARMYRLTLESLFDTATNLIGTIAHSYDLVGNRTNRTASGFTFTPTESLPTQTFAFDHRDEIDGDSNPDNANDRYDANGNTAKDENGLATGDLYDAENHLIKRGASIQLGYDCDGNRAWKTVNGVTTYYLLDNVNPSGYVQVLAEFSNSANPPDLAYTYGHDLISERFPGGTFRYYGLDGQGSVRLLTDSTTSAAITDTHDYDAYGMLLATTGSTPNNYRYTGQQWDSDLGMYVNRARYYRPQIGRFWTMDTYEGFPADPPSLHKYIYCYANPVNRLDLSGHEIGSSLINGIKVHEKLALEFKAQIRGGESGPAISTILESLLPPGTYLPTILMFPDLVDVPNKEVYEIKPFPRWLDGKLQLMMYIAALNHFDTTPGKWKAGDRFRPPDRLYLGAATWAWVKPPSGGVIMYDVLDLPLLAAVSVGVVATSSQADLAITWVTDTFIAMFGCL